MARNNRVCKVCGTNYQFCNNCGTVAPTEKYKTLFCSKNCRDIFHTLSRYTVKSINKYETKEILSSLDMSNLDNFSDKIKLEINEIMGSNKKHSKKKIIEDQVVTEDPVAIEASVEIQEPVVVEEQACAIIFSVCT